MHNPRFADRHIGAGEEAQLVMLDVLGRTSLDDLVNAAIPASVRGRSARAERHLPPSPIAEPLSEVRVAAELRHLASRNVVNRSMIGLGYYDTVTPAVIRRTIFENPHWYTAYTPYQPEIAQGKLEALLNFQTMVAELTALDTANASMLDESTAAAEAMLLLRRASSSSSRVFVIDADLFPQTKSVLAARADALGITLVEIDLASASPADVPLAFGVLLQYPGASGRIWNPAAIIASAHLRGAHVAVAADLLAMTLLTPPGELGADVAVGSAQRFGLPLGYGGPHAGFLAVRAGLERQLPGRLVGVSRDADGAVAYRLALQTREQHIRREKATSNICTSAVLPAVMASMYAVYHGPEGLSQIATEVNRAARLLAATLKSGGLSVLCDDFFDTIQVSVPNRAAQLAHDLHGRGYLARLVDDNTLGFSVDETTDGEDIAAVMSALAAVSSVGERSAAPGPSIPSSMRRTSAFLEHPVFHRYRSETALLRYIRRLGAKDYALDNGMIPLGSCTMKLSSAVSMEAASLPGFAGIHPFAPAEDVQGYLHLIDQFEVWLAELTGYDSVSLQPNAGSQGELAGLLAIRSYHLERGEERRDVCLIPSSAHGTNAASAVLAGMRVVIVDCDELGNVDLTDATQKIADHADRMAALMITYPSTHGVFEDHVTDLCDLAHAAGAQVYIDGANLNAALGYVRFGDIGGDVSHLNLHKTFAIPHGGGGQGVGPVAAKAHLARFLPGHPFAPEVEHSGAAGAHYVHSGSAVSAAPFGGASILPISWAYLRMMGIAGLRRASGSAVLAANYVAERLGGVFPVLYTGEQGLVAHECIFDLRPLYRASGITSIDVAKRLIDYGFHAPTVNFPVVGTLMVEPTESEDLDELDRFVDAMTMIKAEADEVALGVWPADDNPIVNAPHTVASVTAPIWDHPYGRRTAAYPVASLEGDKFWSPVRRINEAYGDRNLACSCPPLAAFETYDEALVGDAVLSAARALPSAARVLRPESADFLL
ncbi:MAG: gcvP [Subtercola sp.]|nr:gcvP [Subtercola sp.]